MRTTVRAFIDSFRQWTVPSALCVFLCNHPLIITRLVCVAGLSMDFVVKAITAWIESRIETALMHLAQSMPTALISPIIKVFVKGPGSLVVP